MRMNNHRFITPGLSTFLNMMTVNSTGGADAGVVLWRQVEVLETLQRNIDIKIRNIKLHIHITTINCVT